MRKQLSPSLTLYFNDQFPCNCTHKSSKKHIVILGIGGNIGNVKRRFNKLFFELKQDCRFEIIKTSPLLKNPPFGYLKQDDFLNGLIKLKTNLSAILLLNEMGLDPGIDHMETMRIVDEVKQKGGKITSLRSFGGGLVSPQYDDNPWGYKITWNPMNVVTAGMASARYVKDGRLKIVPYNRLFIDTEIVDIPVWESL